MRPPPLGSSFGALGCSRQFVLAEAKEPQFVIKPTGSKATVAGWCGLDEFIVTAHEDGTLNLWDTVRIYTPLSCE